MSLYLVGTPIGNLEDITLRALRILKEVTLIAAEDTRTTRKLLNHFEIDAHLTSYHDYSTSEKLNQLLKRLAISDVALVSDAGMPGLSDPGYRLVQAAIHAGISVIPIPGPSAAVTALISSGLPTDKFTFLGFLPRQKAARQQTLQQVVSAPYTLICYEAPHRLIDLLQDIYTVLGNRSLCVGRELTKFHEEIWRGDIDEAIAYFSAGKIRGELTLVIAGATETITQWDEETVKTAVQEKMGLGLSHKIAVAEVASLSGWRKKTVYALTLDK